MRIFRSNIQVLMVDFFMADQLTSQVTFKPTKTMLLTVLLETEE